MEENSSSIGTIKKFLSPRNIFLSIFAAVWLFTIISLPIWEYNMLSKRWAGTDTPRAVFDADFVVFMLPCYMIREGNPRIYNPHEQTKFFTELGIHIANPGLVNYPPTFYFLIMPLTSLSLAAATDVWLLLKYICLFWSAVMLASLVLKEKAAQWQQLLLVAFVGASIYCFSPTLDDIFTGNANSIVLFLLCLSLFLIIKGRKGLAGIALGLAFCIKLVPVFIIIYYVFKREWKIVLSSIITIIIISLLTAIFIGPAIFVDFAGSFLSKAQMGTDFYLNQSILLKLTDLFQANPSLAKWLYLAISLGFLGAAFVRLFKSKNDESPAYVFSLILATTIVIAPSIWTYHFMWLLIPLAFWGKELWEKKMETRREWLNGGLFIAIYGMMANLMNASGEFFYRFEVFQSGAPFIITLLFWGVLLLKKFEQQSPEPVPISEEQVSSPLPGNDASNVVRKV